MYIIENNDQYLKQPVLVTGATGFIGRRVVNRLLWDDVSVRALVLPQEEIPLQWGQEVQIKRGDITDVSSVQEAVRGAGTIIHLAAVVSDWGDEDKYWRLNVEGSRLLFEEAVKNASRVVLASSIAVYGDNIFYRPCPEETGYGKAFGPYSKTKQAQEQLAWEYYKNNCMQLTVIRPANVYGPGSGPWLHDIVDVLKSGFPALVSGGNKNAGLAYVDNVADVLVLAAQKLSTLGRVYNCCDGLEVTWKDYFTDISNIIGTAPPSSVPMLAAQLGANLFHCSWKLLGIKKRPPLTREALNLVGSDHRIPIERQRSELEYEPQVSYTEGMRRIEEYLYLRGDLL